jgi:hypothetical protein
MNFVINLTSTSCPMTIIVEGLLSEMKHDKAIEKWHGNLNPKIREISTMWKILSLTRTTDQTQEEDLHLGEEEGGEDPRDSQITIQEIRTSIVSTMEEDIAPKGAQKPRRISWEFSKRRLWWASHPQCRTNFARIYGSHISWTLNQI